MSDICLNCQGLIPEPNQGYGYSGKFCHCTTPARASTEYKVGSGYGGGGGGTVKPKPIEPVEPINLFKNKKHFVILAMCLPCACRWIGQVIARTSLNRLECPSCGAQESFASFLPPEYTEELL